MEADFQRFYGLHLADLGSHRLTWRRFGHLLAHLPPESATAREVRGGDGTVTNELLAHIANLLASANWQRGHGKGSRPKPIRLTAGDDPNDKKLGGRGVPLEEMRRLLADGSAFVDVGSEAVR